MLHLHKFAKTCMLVAGELSRDGQPCFIPSPDLLLLTSSGRVHFSVASMTALRNHDFIPPEYLPPPHRFSPEAVNKVRTAIELQC